MAIAVTVLVVLVVGAGVLVTRVGLVKIFNELWKDLLRRG